jgi:NADH-quinone oxidoreductase subunit A
MDYLVPYIPIALVLVAALAFGIVNLILGRVFGPQRPNPSKPMAYESGMEPEGEANVRVPVKFYLVGLLFLLFDIEGVFVLAWASIFNDAGIAFETELIPFTQQAFRAFAFFEMLTFMAILMLGYLYVWRKGGLRWS